MTDTDRLNFLLKYFCVDDIGDDSYVPGVIIRSESLEDFLTWGKEAPKRMNQCKDTGDFRVIIDRAISSEKGINMEGGNKILANDYYAEKLRQLDLEKTENSNGNAV